MRPRPVITRNPTGADAQPQRQVREQQAGLLATKKSKGVLDLSVCLGRSGTVSQLRSQLRVVHEAVLATAEAPLGHVVSGDFLYDQIAGNLVSTAQLPKEVFENVQRFAAGDANAQLKAKLLKLIYLINKLPADAAMDLGLKATEEALADLLVTNLAAGSSELRKSLQALLEELQNKDRLVMALAGGNGTEYRLQTRESSAWYDEFRAQEAELKAAPQRVEQKRADLLKNRFAEVLKKVRVTQGKGNEVRTLSPTYDDTLPKDNDKSLYAPGVSSFIAGADYAHGGLSLQECLVPVLDVVVAAPAAAAQVWVLSPGGDEEHPGLFRLEVNEGPGSGMRVLNNPVPAAFKESIRCAEQNLYARAQQLVGDRDPRSHEFSVQLRGFDAAKAGAKTGVGALIALSSALLKKSVRGGLVVVGEVTLGGTIEPVHNAVTLAEIAIEKGAKALLLPVSCRRQLFDLSDEMATKLDIEFYQDGRDALLKALTE